MQVLNPTEATFNDPFQFEITFECTDNLAEDIEWKVIYVGSAEDQEHDQELEAIMVGPLPVGASRFLSALDAFELKYPVRGISFSDGLYLASSCLSCPSAPPH